MIRKLVGALLALLIAGTGAQAEPVHVLAAFTFKRSLDAVIKLYQATGADQVVADYGATPALAKQIEGGIPGDIFLSADPKWMAYLADRRLIQPDSRVDLLSSDLVLVTRSDNRQAPLRATVSRDFPLSNVLGGGRVAMCDPASAPVGRLGEAGLKAAGLWPTVKDRVAIAENPMAAISLVVRGEAPVAVVFATDAHGVSGIKVAGVFPASTHPPIVFPAALLRSSRAPGAKRFFAFLASPQARAVFERFGYSGAAGR
jgi:molybdate transport system substrate-binding protein